MALNQVIQIRGRAVRIGLAVVLAAAVFAYAFVSWKNLWEVDPGRFYRSGQLTDAQLRDVIDQYGIRTVVNLRGAHVGDAWYRAESAVARDAGVELVDIQLRSWRLPHRADLIRLLDTYRDAERPILVHCFSGADRAGLASAVYQIDQMGRSKSEAQASLSARYLHIPWLRPAMRHFVDLYEGEAWARSHYDPCRADERYYDHARYCTPPGSQQARRD